MVKKCSTVSSDLKRQFSSLKTRWEASPFLTAPETAHLVLPYSTCLHASLVRSQRSFNIWIVASTGREGASDENHQVCLSFKRCSQNDLRYMVWSLGLSCAGPEVGLNGPCRSLPNQDTQWFTDNCLIQKYYGFCLEVAAIPQHDFMKRCVNWSVKTGNALICLRIIRE